MLPHQATPRQAMQPPKRVRRLFVAGTTITKRNRRRCYQGNHHGPLLDTDLFNAAGGLWKDMGNCALCGSTIHRSQIRRTA